jgi:hypothetical protein
VVSAQGILHVHSAPAALCPHIEWAVAGIIGTGADMSWTGQPAAPGSLRAELAFRAQPGAAAAITSALASWGRLRFEVTEDPSPGCDGIRYSYTPTLGTFTAVTGANGDILVPEGRLRAALAAAAAGGPLDAELTRLLGQAWDDELEPFRRAGDRVRWLTAVG